VDTQVDNHIDPSSVFEVSETLKLISDPTRIKILWALLHGEHSVNGLSEHVGAQPPAVSQHLAKLRIAGLVSVKREGNKMLYSSSNRYVQNIIEQALLSTNKEQKEHHNG